MASVPTDPPDGLRERKKRRTREEISDVATRLFFARGFEAVTLAEIAAAAEVSVKTIFNHFGSKEDLYFDRMGELRAGLVSTVADRPAGTTALAALRALLVDNRVAFPGEGWAGLEDERGYAGFRAFVATEDRSPALRARRLVIMHAIEEDLRGVLARELGRSPDDAAIQALAAMLSGVLHLRDRVLRAAIAEGAAPAEVRRRVVEVVEEAFRRLMAAFAELDAAEPGYG